MPNDNIIVSNQISELKLTDKKIKFPQIEPRAPLEAKDYEQFLDLAREKFQSDKNKPTIIDEMEIVCYGPQALEGVIAYKGKTSSEFFKTLVINIDNIDFTKEDNQDKFIEDIITVLTLSKDQLEQLQFVDTHNKITPRMIKKLYDAVMKKEEINTEIILPEGFQNFVKLPPAPSINLPPEALKPMATAQSRGVRGAGGRGGFAPRPPQPEKLIKSLQKNLDQEMSNRIFIKNSTQKLNSQAPAEEPEVKKEVRKRVRGGGKNLNIDIELQQEQQVEVAVEASVQAEVAQEREGLENEGDYIDFNRFSWSIETGYFDINSKYYLVNPAEAKNLWLTWTGTLTEEAALEGQTSNREVSFISRKACEELLLHKEKFQYGIDLKNLPAGFTLIEKDNKLHLTFDEKLKNFTLYNPLKVQTIALPGENPLPHQSLELLFRTDPYKKNPSVKYLKKSFWEDLNRDYKSYDRESHKLFKQFLPQMILLDESQLKALKEACLMDDKLDTKLFKFLLEDAKTLQKIPEDKRKKILKKLFTDNFQFKNEHHYNFILGNANKFISNYKETPLELKDHFINLYINEHTKDNIQKLCDAGANINLNALLQLYIQKGEPGIENFLNIANNDLDLFILLNNLIFSKYKNYINLLDEQTVDAIRTVGAFDKVERTWFNSLLQQHCEAHTEVNLVDMVNAFKKFKEEIKSDNLTLPETCDMKGVKSLPVALSRISYLLKYSNEQNRQAQLEAVKNLDLSSQGAINCITRERPDGYKWGFITPEMKITPAQEGRSAGLYEENRKEGFTHIEHEDMEEVAKRFFRAVSLQEKGGQLPLEFYNYVHKKISENTKINDQNKKALYQAVAAASVGVRNVSNLSLKEAKEHFDEIINKLGDPFKNSTAIKYSVGAIGSIKNEVIEGILEEINHLPLTPPLPVFNKLLKTILGSITINPQQLKKNQDRLEKNQSDLRFYTDSYGTSVYQGLLEYSDKDYEREDLFDTHLQAIEVIHQAKGFQGLSAPEIKEYKKLLISLISTFNLTKDDLQNTILPYFQIENDQELPRKREALQILQSLSYKNLENGKRLNKDHLKQISTAINGSEVSEILQNITLDDTSLEKYLPENMLKLYSAKGIPDEVKRLIASSFPNEEHQKFVKDILANFNKNGDNLHYKEIVKKIHASYQHLSTPNEKELFLRTLQNSLGLYTNITLSDQDNHFMAFLTTLQARGIDEFLNLVATERHLLKNTSPGKKQEFVTTFNNKEFIDNLSQRANLFITTLLPDAKSTIKQLPFTDLMPVLHKIILKTPIDQLEKDSAVTNEKDKNFGPIISSLENASKVFKEESQEKELDFAKIYESTDTFLKTDTIKNPEIYESYRIKVKELKERGKLTLEETFRLIKIKNLMGDESIQALIEKAYPDIIRNSNLNEYSLSNPQFMNELRKKDVLAAMNAPNLTSDEKKMRLVLDALNKDLQGIADFKKITTQLSEDLKQQREKLKKYPSVFKEVNRKINDIATENENIKRQFLALYEAYLDNYSPAHDGEILVYLTNFVTLLEQSFKEIKNKNIVLSLCFQFKGEHLKPKDLIALLEEVNTFQDNKENILKIAIVLINNEKGYSIEKFKELCKEIKANPDFANFIHNAYQNAPYPTIDQILAWNEKVSSRNKDDDYQSEMQQALQQQGLKKEKIIDQSSKKYNLSDIRNLREEKIKLLSQEVPAEGQGSKKRTELEGTLGIILENIKNQENVQFDIAYKILSEFDYSIFTEPEQETFENYKKVVEEFKNCKIPTGFDLINYKGNLSLLLKESEKQPLLQKFNININDKNFEKFLNKNLKFLLNLSSIINIPNLKFRQSINTLEGKKKVLEALEKDLTSIANFQKETEELQSIFSKKLSSSAFENLDREIDGIITYSDVKNQFLELYHNYLNRYSFEQDGNLSLYLDNFANISQQILQEVQAHEIFADLIANLRDKPENLIKIFSTVRKEVEDREKRIVILKIASKSADFSVEDFKKLCVLMQTETNFSRFAKSIDTPYPTIGQLLSWHETVQKEITYSTRMQKAYDKFATSPCHRELYERDSKGEYTQTPLNGFHAADAKKILPKFTGIGDFEKTFDPEKFEIITRNLQEKTPAELLKIFAKYNPASKTYDKEQARDLETLVAIAAELMHKSKGQDLKDAKGNYKLGSSMEINTTQYLAILTAIKGSPHSTSEIGTGEGKSRIMAIQNACKFARGGTVDFVTSDAQLATRDFVEYQAYYDMIGAETAMIFADSDPSSYKIKGINFSDSANLNLFRNKARSNGQGHLVIDPDSKQRGLMLDEADKSYFDMARTRFNFSGEGDPSIRGMEWIYTLLMEYFAQETVSTKKRQYSPINLYEEDMDLSRENFLDFAITSIPREYLARIKLISAAQIEQWQDSAVTAKRLEFKEDFVIEPDRLVNTSKGPKIVSEAQLLFSNRVAKQAKFSFGVHQCLHARLNLAKNHPEYEKNAKLTDALKKCEKEFYIPDEKQILYSSTSKNFLDDYSEGEIKAVTGTSGAKLEIEEAAILYGHGKEHMQFITAPRHRGMNRKDFPIRLKDQKSQIDALIKQIKDALKKNQPILIIAENDDESALLFNKLAEKFPSGIQHIHSQLSLDEEKTTIAKAGQPGMITVSTDMVGRGVDVSLQGDSEQHGLNVMVTYLPRPRDLAQIIGRSGRFGAAGETSLVLVKKSLKKALGKETLTDGFYTNTEAYIKREQALMDRKEQCIRLIQNTVGDFRKILTDSAFELVNGVAPANRQDLINHWVKFFDESDKKWNKKWPHIQNKLIDPINIQEVEDLLKEYQEDVAKEWQVFSQKATATNIISNDKSSAVNKLIKTVPQLSLSAGTKKLLSTFNLNEYNLKKRQKFDYYDPAHDGRGVKYTSWTIPAKASLKGWANFLKPWPTENRNRSVLGARRPFANFQAWSKGRGILFPKLRASKNTAKIVGATLGGVLGLGIAAGLILTGVFAPVGLVILGTNLSAAAVGIGAGVVGSMAASLIGLSIGAIVDKVNRSTKFKVSKQAEVDKESSNKNVIERKGKECPGSVASLGIEPPHNSNVGQLLQQQASQESIPLKQYEKKRDIDPAKRENYDIDQGEQKPSKDTSQIEEDAKIREEPRQSGPR